PRAAIRVAEVHGEKTRRVEIRDRARLLGRDRDLDAQAIRGLQEVVRAVSRRGQEEEDARHPAILTGARTSPVIAELSRDLRRRAGAAHSQRKEVAMPVAATRSPRKFPPLLMAALVAAPL